MENDLLIRPATEADIPRMVEMGQRFHDETTYQKHLPSNPEQMHKIGKQLIDLDGLLVSEREGKIVGMIGFVVFPHFLSGELVCGEAFWWVDPEYRGEGIRLMREAEKSACARGAKKMQMIAPTDQVGHVYQRLGYEFVESAYQKSL